MTFQGLSFGSKSLQFARIVCASFSYVYGYELFVCCGVFLVFQGNALIAFSLKLSALAALCIPAFTRYAFRFLIVLNFRPTYFAVVTAELFFVDVVS